jgi:hypothetical protein
MWKHPTHPAMTSPTSPLREHNREKEKRKKKIGDGERSGAEDKYTHYYNFGVSYLLPFHQTSVSIPGSLV